MLHETLQNLPAEEQKPKSMNANIEKKNPAASLIFTLSKNERDCTDSASDACLEDMAGFGSTICFCHFSYKSF